MLSSKKLYGYGQMEEMEQMKENLVIRRIDMEKRVADIIMETLLEMNRHLFGVVVWGAMHLDNALLKCTDMRKYLIIMNRYLQWQ